MSFKTQIYNGMSSNKLPTYKPYDRNSDKIVDRNLGFLFNKY